MSTLVIGIPGAVVLSVFSSSLINSGFLVPRTVPATAVLFTEPESMSQRRKITSSLSSHSNSQSCGRPLIPIGQKVNIAKQKFSPILDKISKPVSLVQSKIVMFKTKLFDKLGLQCLVPNLLKDIEPYITRISCKLGLNGDGFMQVPSCSSNLCSKSVIEEKEITRHLEAPIFDITNLRVQTMDDCFREMGKVTYGSRILAKLVDDQACDDPRFTSFCDELFGQDRVIMKETCENDR